MFNLILVGGRRERATGVTETPKPVSLSRDISPPNAANDSLSTARGVGVRVVGLVKS